MFINILFSNIIMLKIVVIIKLLLFNSVLSKKTKHFKNKVHTK